MIFTGVVLVLFVALSTLTVVRVRVFRAATATNDVIVRVTVVNAGVTIHLRAIPEKRVPTTGNNSTVLTVEVRNHGSTTPLFSGTVTTGSGGTYSGLVLSGISAGTYDITAKGYSHLRRLVSNVSVSSGATFDFTSNGTTPLLCGDVNGTNGDNKVNGIDLSLIVGALRGSNPRYDLNRDGLVNGIDLSNAVGNLNVTGDS